MKHINKLALAAACLPGMVLNAAPVPEDNTADVSSQVGAGEIEPVDPGAEPAAASNSPEGHTAAATPGACDCEGSDCADLEAGGCGGYNMAGGDNANSTDADSGCDGRPDCDLVSPDGRGGYNMFGNGTTTANATEDGGDCADVEAGGRGGYNMVDDNDTNRSDDGCDDPPTVILVRLMEVAGTGCSLSGPPTQILLPLLISSKSCGALTAKRWPWPMDIGSRC
ncbi:uncharacterized protein BO66DRAFT_458299 [Aspergillus aculeatinus CBS 121060]|uniref:Uncharacterized protein n=1 Tax=Aspergillus aculeatinus CBS 121060 TaxID=1448322 RepID=A0ACD1H067_9EURO|nr:hypothetical protein BO66DRAFT_458299 [Aspergillus aculeatinus CBS 121060]RAH67127.1 hypothetical protein BO66DRAFT_458299 [Aspergillus aculeatinus CBS 121060]